MNSLADRRNVPKVLTSGRGGYTGKNSTGTVIDMQFDQSIFQTIQERPLSVFGKRKRSLSIFLSHRQNDLHPASFHDLVRKLSVVRADHKSADEIRYEELTSKRFSDGLNEEEAGELQNIEERLDEADALDAELAATKKRIVEGYGELRSDLAAINAMLDRHLRR